MSRIWPKDMVRFQCNILYCIIIKFVVFCCFVLNVIIFFALHWMNHTVWTRWLRQTKTTAKAHWHNNGYKNYGHSIEWLAKVDEKRSTNGRILQNSPKMTMIFWVLAAFCENITRIPRPLRITPEKISKSEFNQTFNKWKLSIVARPNGQLCIRISLLA